MGRIKKTKNKNPLILIKCEGYPSAERIYFSNFQSRNCTIKFSTGNSTDPIGMLNELKDYMNKEDINKDNAKIFLVLDTDLNSKRIREIKGIERECNELGIQIITSSPTFEIWYLLHYRNTNLSFDTSKEVKKELRKIIKNYKETMNIYGITNNMTDEAIKNAKIIEKRFKTDAKDNYSFTPHSYIYIILEEIKILTNDNE